MVASSTMVMRRSIRMGRTTTTSVDKLDGPVFNTNATGTSSATNVVAEDVMVDVASLSFRADGQKAAPAPIPKPPVATELDNLHNLGPSWYEDSHVTASSAV